MSDADVKEGTAAGDSVAVPESVVKPDEGRRSRGESTGGTAAGDTGVPKNIARCLVYCRLRPRNKTDFKNGGFQLVTVSGNDIVVKDQRFYKFDGAFGDECTQSDIFEAVAVPCITHAFKGFCSALMCYGQTGTGKSFTMCNTTPGQEGIIPRSAKLIFDKIQSDNARSYEVTGQFVQIYRDNLGDLMSATGRDRVDIHFDEQGGVELTGCSSHVLLSAQEFMRFYRIGNDRRVVTATAMNPESSRGHTALVLRIVSESPSDPEAGKLKGKITFIDLAGYERFSKTGITHDNPIMKDEAKCINASLLSLGHVVSCLSSGSRHIPWRDSKLTRILQDSIGGRSRTSIILTVGPSSDHLHETTNSLQFGLRAMDVKVTAKQSVHVDYQKLAQKLQSLLDERDERINLLEVQIASRDAERHELMERYNDRREDIDRRFEIEMAELKRTGASEEQMLNLREVYKAEVENLQEQQDEEFQYREEVYSKEIVHLIREQEHQEAKRRAEMKLAQDLIIAEFQKKLDNAREGTNDDLVRVLKQLSEKDAILASRANDTVRLHEHIEVLREQVKELGGVPIEEATFPETFLDVGQVEEMRNRLEADVQRHRAKGVELLAEVDRLSQLCSERLEEINRLRDENTQYRAALENSGISLNDTDDLTEFLSEKRTQMVDVSEMETLRVTMQADLDEAKAHNRELAREVEQLKFELTATAIPLTARLRCPPCATARGPSPFDAARNLCSTQRKPPQKDGTPSPNNTQNENLQRTVKQLTEQLEFSMRERKSLQDRVEAVETQLASHGVEVPGPYVPPIKLGFPGSAPVTSSETDAREPPEDTDMDVLLRVKEEEIDVLLETIERQEHLLNAARSNEEFHRRVICELQQQMVTAQIQVEDPQNAPPPVDAIAMDEYMSILRLVRESERKLAAQLAERDGEDGAEVEALLEKKDAELQMKEETILEKASKAQYAAKLCIRLKNQMLRCGITPCCELPDSYNELIEREEEELNEQLMCQDELLARLRSEEEEKHRMQNMLKSLNEERERQSSVIRTVQERCELVEKKQLVTAAHLSRLATEKSQREQILEETLRRATQELLDCKIKMAMEKEAGSPGVLKRFLRRLRSN
ncbi:kinesin, putative [Trypanosoma equiperdum]|uniref:Kinesin, putative n=2 Tax=Trypanozoon TaxID=39700 RepID=Q587A5_TRYB2|nr:kinesin, putative [Trypanosoma brucei brucei TREU927]AAX79272.1 kinesin, putative [Trypanosoma brucei]AAZ11997.1 kinesin, putative [Trypanosoma brucei brucei TREU927]SCU65329.1 kinesin, putative [Trypanosoma equiperdum]